MMKLLKVCTAIYDRFHRSSAGTAFFFRPQNADAYAAYYTSMYLIQDTGEAVLTHMAKDFSADPMQAYLEFWGVMQAINIQQDSILQVQEAVVPAVAMLYKFGRANILQGKPPFDPTFEWLPVPYFDHAVLRQAMTKYGWDGQLQSKMVPEQFARMLAKIAYSYAIAELGFGAFEPLCLDIILGKAN